MATKIVVPDENQKGGNRAGHKKRGLTVFLTVLFVFLALFAIVFTVGWFVGDKYLNEYLDVSMKDTASVVVGLYGTKDKDVVKNPYGDDDLDAFYDEIKTNLLLKKDADIDFDGALAAAMDNYLNKEDPSGSTDGSTDGTADETVDGSASALRRNAEGDGETPEGESGTGEGESGNPEGESGNPEGESGTGEGGDSSSSTSGAAGSLVDVFTNMLVEVFNRDNLDVETLKLYSEENDNYIFNLNDKGLAAFLNSFITVLLENSDSIDALKSVSEYVSLKDVVKLKQIQFKATSAKNELGEEQIIATTADLTLWVGLQKTAGQALGNMVTEYGYGWAKGVVGWLMNVILPKNFYVTLTVPLTGNSSAQVVLNDMDTAKRDKVYKLIDGIMSLTGTDMSVSDMLGKVTNTIQPYMQKIANNINFESAAQGTLKLDFIDALTKFVNRGKDEADALSKADFMYMLQALLTSDPDVRLAQLKPYLYDGWFTDGTGEPVYRPEDTTGLTAVDYRKEFVKEIENKYCVDFGDDATLDDVLAMLGISLDGSNQSAGSTDLMNMINSARLKEAIRVEDVDTLDLEVTDRMLAAAFSNQLDSLLGTDELAGVHIALDAITFVSNPDKPGRLYALLAVDVGFDGIVSSLGDNTLGKLAANILPEKILLSVTVDISLSLPAGEEHDEVTFEFNDYENTDRVLGTLAKLIPSLDMSKVASDLDVMLRDMVQKLDEKLDIRLVPSVVTEETTTQGELVMPNIFALLSDMVLVDEAGAPIFPKDGDPAGDERLKNVLNGLNNTDHLLPLLEIEAPSSYKHFIDEVVDKYYLNDGYRDENGELQPLETFEDLTAFVTGFNAKKFRIKEAVSEKPALAYDTRSGSRLEPLMTGDDLGAIIADKMPGNESVGNFSIREIQNIDNGIVIILSIGIENLLPENLRSIVTATHVFVTATIRTDDEHIIGDGTEEDPRRYAVECRLNSMNQATHDDALLIVQTLDKSMDIPGLVSEMGKIMFDQIASLKNSLDPDGKIGKNIISFKTDGIHLTDFYSFIGGKMGLNMNPEKQDETGELFTSSDIQKALQGMYERKPGSSENNYVYGDFVKNASTSTDSYAQILAALGTGIVTDKQFNGAFQSGIGVSSDGSCVKSVQTVIIAPNDTSADATAFRNWASSHASSIEPSDGDVVLSNTGSYMLVTFGLAMDKFLVGGADKAEFLPETIYATAVVELKAAPNASSPQSFDLIGIVFNNMERSTYKVMYKLMGLDPSNTEGTEDTVNIVTITEDCTRLLNDFAVSAHAAGKTLVFGATSDESDGVGTAAML